MITRWYFDFFLYKLICILKENTKLLKIYTRGEITKIIIIIIIMESGGNNRSLIVILVGSAQLIVNVVTEI